MKSTREASSEWKDVSSQLLNKKSGVLASLLGKSKKEFYRYLSEDMATPIAKVLIKPENGQAESVEFKTNARISHTSRYVDNGKTNIYAYPNPAIDDIRFELVNLQPGEYKLKLFNILGMEVLKKSYRASGNKTIELSLSKLKKGTYLYSLINERGKTITTKRLMIIRP